jgi:hypothetical protein
MIIHLLQWADSMKFYREDMQLKVTSTQYFLIS